MYAQLEQFITNATAGFACADSAGGFPRQIQPLMESRDLANPVTALQARLPPFLPR
jgi:hypothetical protein